MESLALQLSSVVVPVPHEALGVGLALLGDLALDLDLVLAHRGVLSSFGKSIVTQKEPEGQPLSAPFSSEFQ